MLGSPASSRTPFLSISHPAVIRGLPWSTSFLGLHKIILQTRWHLQIKIYPLIVLEVRNPKSRCWQGHALSREESAIASFYFTARTPWCSLICSLGTAISVSSYSLLLVRLRVSVFPSSYNDSSNWIRSVVLTYDLMLMWLHLKDLVSK